MESGHARLPRPFARRSSPTESARGLAQSKTLRVVESRRNSRQRPGLRRPSAAFPPARVCDPQSIANPGGIEIHDGFPASTLLRLTESRSAPFGARRSRRFTVRIETRVDIFPRLTTPHLEAT